jgi:hypothetical protein
VAVLAFVFWPKKKTDSASWTTPVPARTASPPKPAPATSPAKPSAPARLWDVEFSLHAPGAIRVYLAGSFNNWSKTANPLQHRPNGDWIISLRLPAGTYSYKFFVDGKWVVDPDNADRADDGYGGKNSILRVGN